MCPVQLSEFHGAKTPAILDVLEFELLVPVRCEKQVRWKTQRNLLLALRMKIYTAYGSLHLIETDIVEPLEACSVDIRHAMIWDEEMLFPPHEYVFSLRIVLVGEVRLLGLLGQWPPRREPCPMLHVGFVCGTPVWMFSLESMFRADYLALEEGG